MLTLDPIVRVNVNLALKSALRKGFNLGLIIGDATIISESERVRVYSNMDSMLTDGFTTEDEEYKAALLYFAAPSHPTRVAIGRKGPEDTVLQAVTACRQANSEWYAVTVTGTVNTSDIEAVAGYIETAEPSSVFMYNINSVDVLSSDGAERDIFIKLKKKLYRRSFGLYCSHEETPNSVASIMGYAMGANRGTADSAYTLAYKTMVGVETDPLSQAQVEYIISNNGNCYINRAEQYNVLQQGYMADRTSFDEVINLDMLKNEIQLSIMDLLYQRTKVPQTEAGMTAIINNVNIACDKFVRTGFIAPGQWNGAPCLSLETGDYLPAGYIVLSESIDEQSQADRDARKAPPVYACIKLAGAIEFVIIEVNVNR